MIKALTKYTFRCLLGFTLITSLVLIFLLTPIGLQMCVDIGRHFLPGKLAYEKLSGSLLTPIQFKNIHYQVGDTSIRVQSLKLRWQVHLLINSKIVIDSLKAEHINVTLSPTNNKTNKPTQSISTTIENILQTLHINPFINTPIPIEIQQASFNHIQINTEPNQPPWLLPNINFDASLLPKRTQLRIKSNVVKPYLIHATLQLNSEPNHYQFTLAARNHDFHWRLQGTGDANQLKIKSDESDLFHGTVQGDVALQWLPTPQWTINVHAKKLQLTQMQKSLPSHLTLTLQSQGKFLQGRPIFAWSIHLTTADAYAKTSGHYDNTWMIDWNATIHRLNEFLPKANGYVITQGKFNGTLSQFATEGNLNASQLQVLGLTAEKLQANWDMNTSNTRPSHFQLKAQQAIVDGTKLDTLLMTAKGTLAAHNIRLNAETDFANLQLHANGQLQSHHWKNPDWSGKINQLNLRTYQAGLWQLTKASSLTLSSQRIQWSPVCLTNFEQASKLCVTDKSTQNLFAVNVLLKLKQQNRAELNLRLPKWAQKNIPFDQQAIQGQLQLHMNTLDALNQFLPNTVISSGQLNANLTLGGSVKMPSIRGKARLQNASITIPAYGLTLTGTTIALSASGKHLRFSGTAYSRGKPITLTGHTNLSKDSFDTTLKLKGNNLLVANTPEYSVYASPDLTIRWQTPDITIDGQILIPSASIKPRDFSNVVTLPKNEVVIIGQAPPKTLPGIFLGTITLKLGNNVRIDTNGIRGHLTGELTIVSKPKQPLLTTGSVYIRDGSYTNFGKIFTIDKNSYVHYTNDPISNPKLNVRASKTIKRTVAAGATQFNQSDIIVGVQLTGSLKHPKANLFSIPAGLSQADILSYLVLGTPSGAQSSGNIALLVDAVNALNLGGDNRPGGILDQLRQTLGLSEFGVESVDTLGAFDTPTQQQSAFVVGKRFFKNFYLRYSYGLSNNQAQRLYNPNVLQLRYQLGRNWVLQWTQATDSSTDATIVGNGIDIFYTLERN